MCVHMHAGANTPPPFVSIARNEGRGRDVLWVSDVGRCVFVGVVRRPLLATGVRFGTVPLKVEHLQILSAHCHSRASQHVLAVVKMMFG